MILVTLTCVSTSKIIAQNKPFTINPDQVKNVYTGLVQNDSLRSRLIFCEAAAVKFDSLIQVSNKKTIDLVSQVKSKNDQTDKLQESLNENIKSLDRYEKFSPMWFVTFFVLGVAGGLYLGNL